MEQHLYPTEFDLVQTEAENNVARFQRRYGFPYSPPVPVEMIAKALFGLRCEFRKLGRWGKRTTGALFKDDSVIYVDERCNRHQYVFAVAHEIGHWVMHEGNHCSRLSIGKAESIPWTHILRSARAQKKRYKAGLREIEANQFAAALLIPRPFLFSLAKNYEVIDANAIDELARAFWVSREAMLYRVRDLWRHREWREWKGPPIDGRLLHQSMGVMTQPRRAERRDPNDLRGQRRARIVRETYVEPRTVELAGMPNAGKDIWGELIKECLEDVCGYRVRIIPEAVETSCHIDKKQSDIHRFWKTVALAVTQLHEARFENPGNYDIVIFNRGLFDRLALLHAMRLSGRISEEQERVHADYLVSYAPLLDIAFLLLISPEESHRREMETKRKLVAEFAEYDNIPKTKVRSPRMHDKEMLTALNLSYLYAYKTYRQFFDNRIYLLDSASWNDPHARDESTLLQVRGMIDVILPENPAQLPVPELASFQCTTRLSPSKRNHSGQRYVAKTPYESAVQLSLL